MGPFSLRQLSAALITDAVVVYFRVLFTEVEESQVLEMGPIEVETPLLLDDVLGCIHT